MNPFYESERYTRCAYFSLKSEVQKQQLKEFLHSIAEALAGASMHALNSEANNTAT